MTMNTRPNTKTCYSRAVVCYHIATGKRRQFPSVTKASAFVGVSPSWLGNIIRGNMKADDYVCAYVEDEAKAIEKLHFYQRKCEYKRTLRVKGGEFVALRIDSRTIIMVKPEDANEEYAERYREKLADTRSSLANGFIQRNDNINQTKPRKGRQKKYE